MKIAPPKLTNKQTNGKNNSKHNCKIATIYSDFGHSNLLFKFKAYLMLNIQINHSSRISVRYTLIGLLQKNNA